MSEFALADDALSNAPGEYDFVNSYMALQHVPVRPRPDDHRPADRQGEAGRRVHVHLSIRTDRMRSRALWWASHHIPGVKIWQNVFAGRPWNAPAMQMNNYPLNEVMTQMLASQGITEFAVFTEQHAKFLTSPDRKAKRHRLKSDLPNIDNYFIVFRYHELEFRR